MGRKREEKAMPRAINMNHQSGNRGGMEFLIRMGVKSQLHVGTN